VQKLAILADLILTIYKTQKHTHNNQLEPPLPYLQQLFPLPPWVDQRCHQCMALPLPMVPCKALAVWFGSAMRHGGFVCFDGHLPPHKKRDWSLALGGRCLMMTHNNQLKVSFRGTGDVREEAHRGRSVWGDAIPSFGPSN